jgi:iron(III) transport system substrate-binding protein
MGFGTRLPGASRRPVSATAAALALAACAAMASCARAALPEKPAELVVFSPHELDMVESVVREFRQRTGIRVSVATSGTGNLLERVRKGEGRADLLWGGGVETLESAKDLFTEYRSPEDAAIDPAYGAAHGLWHPYSVLPLVILYNSRLVPEKLVPASWADLLEPYFKNRIILYDPAQSGFSFTTIATMVLAMSRPGTDDREGWGYARRFAGQLDPELISKETRLAYDAVACGDFFAGFASEEAAITLAKSGAEIGYRFPREGTSAVPDGIAIFKGAANPAAAGRFVDFVLGRDVQRLLRSKWLRRSVRVDVEGAARNDAGMRLLPYDVAGTAARRELILRRWKDAVAASRP